MPGAVDINLVPSLVGPGQFDDLVKAGQTISSVLSPADNSFAVYITNAVSILETWKLLLS